LGFEDVQIDIKESSACFVKDWVPGHHAEKYVLAAEITGRKGEGKLPAKRKEVPVKRS